MELNTIVKALEEGLVVENYHGRCGRAYVTLVCDRKTTNLVKKAATKVGIRYLNEAYGTSGHVLCCGYDNADGRALAIADKIEKNLREIGIKCYADAVAD